MILGATWEKKLTWQDDFQIKDQNGVPVVVCSGKAFSLRDRKSESSLHVSAGLRLMFSHYRYDWQRIVSFEKQDDVYPQDLRRRRRPREGAIQSHQEDG